MTARTPSSGLRRELQRELFRLVLSIVVVDAVAIGAYSLTGMEDRGRTTRFLFTAIWVAATLLVVVPGLRKIRQLRVKVRRGM